MILKDVDKSILPFIPTEDELSGETTHLSVMDVDGMAVSLTQSVERVYGSKAAACGLGFIYNNYLYDFEYNQPKHPFFCDRMPSPGRPWLPLLFLTKIKSGWLWVVLEVNGSSQP